MKYLSYRTVQKKKVKLFYLENSVHASYSRNVRGALLKYLQGKAFLKNLLKHSGRVNLSNVKCLFYRVIVIKAQVDL